MKYSVFIIYVLIVCQLIDSMPITGGVARGHYYYESHGIVNTILGVGGLTAFNMFLRNKNIIPETFVQIGMIGCGILFLYGVHCTIKAILKW